ncbi:THYMIDYLATE KINASE [Encephalitozoon cuniculi GB-M1]|uniref:dTMP kinase n=2 Tax=Encephalitozoon cuniculi TaxID=6035 RepID=Q8SS22_ENCCU|nr:bifunctional thymidylate/uridylate kinase [Encephalitozoon cuniculi GB-M1]AGE95310.1 thymidylate kinase [Encephalitozoon cuniculi]KMV66325.1 thymidylate kinase [Encephalitozoon cuniculi EcunIII-L]UYI27504.1 thymidylate kinase [Encephalitozoon cuniculi]CAD25310.1 THYMIDYLATE KINASE [Encephalitozoon cuniculi GB-M1]
MSKGKFVVFEGLDRSGKTTIVGSLYESLLPIVPTSKIRFPNRSGPVGKIIDGYLQKKTNLESETIHLLFSADRYEHRLMIEELRRDTIILCDRYSMSGIAYSVAKGLSLDWCIASEALLPKPDLTIFIDVPMDEICRRKGFGTEIHDTVPFLKKVLSAYQALLKKEENTLVVDGTLPVREVVEIVRKRILG